MQLLIFPGYYHERLGYGQPEQPEGRQPNQRDLGLQQETDRVERLLDQGSPYE